MAPAEASHDRERLLALYRQMLLIRLAEEQLASLFEAGEVPGFIHLSIGQEAVAAGVCAALGPLDTVASNHRGHGHALAKGVTLEALFAEIMGRDSGICRGRGGSMHVADRSVGMLGANGIVGAGLAIAVGSALAHQVRRSGGIAVVFFGDGALAEGALHESFNLAALWKLPLLAVCENNGWGEFSPTERQLATTLDRVAASFALPYASVDGNDAGAVAAQAAGMVEAVRAGRGPQVLECHTTRLRGHFEGDPQKYRAKDELAASTARCPVARARAELGAAGVAEAVLERVRAEAAGLVAAAVAAARAAPLPDYAAAAGDVYAASEAVHG